MSYYLKNSYLKKLGLVVSICTPFQKKVWAALRAIPRGEVRTYGEIARAIGSPKAYRAVASACAANPNPIIVPCHRVVPASGGVGDYAYGGPKKKRVLLESEGVFL